MSKIIFNIPSNESLIKMIKADLKEAGISAGKYSIRKAKDWDTEFIIRDKDVDRHTVKWILNDYEFSVTVGAMPQITLGETTMFHPRCYYDNKMVEDYVKENWDMIDELLTNKESDPVARWKQPGEISTKPEFHSDERYLHMKTDLSESFFDSALYYFSIKKETA